jgi:hypothetical protein
MIWLYLAFGLAAGVGLFMVAVEWGRGVRHGLFGSFSTFGLLLVLAVGGLLWVRAIEQPAGGGSAAPATEGASIDPAAREPRSSRPRSSAPEERAPERDPLGPRNRFSSWWSLERVGRLLEGALASVLGGLLLAGVQGLRRNRRKS